MVGPGNARELEKLLNEQSYLGRPALILPEALPEAVLKNLPLRWRPAGYYEPVTQTKRDIILK